VHSLPAATPVRRWTKSEPQETVSLSPAVLCFFHPKKISLYNIYTDEDAIYHTKIFKKIAENSIFLNPAIFLNLI